MVTDFFDRQDHARRETVRLLVMFVLAVMVIILVVYLVLVLVAGAYEIAAVPVRSSMEERRQTEASSTALRAYQTATDPMEMEQAKRQVDEELERVQMRLRKRNLPRAVEQKGEATDATEMAAHPALTFWHPALFLWAALGSILIIAVTTLNKIRELSDGGEVVALMLGGREVSSQSPYFAERRLLNVVEEMALASGVPVPPVFVLDGEPGINAFVAGHQPGDAVVAVSSGCLKYLTREELQGMMGHEFSHILNGDMRLNLRLIGLVHGILFLALLGECAMRSADSSGPLSTSRPDSRNTVVFVVGIVLFALGCLGGMLGKLIKLAINRQREYLADASAVQFTRWPAGIIGALKKIGGLSEGSCIRDAHAMEVSHMFFGDAFSGFFFNIFATHPPLRRRIRALEPEFDGRFPTVRPLVAASLGIESGGARWPLPTLLPADEFPASGDVLGDAATASPSGKLHAGGIMPHIGHPSAEHLHHASQIAGGMPPLLLDAARESFNAQAVIYALLLSRDDEAVRARQLETLKGQVSFPLYQELGHLAAVAISLPTATRLPLVDLAMPALRRLSSEQYASFRKVVDGLANTDYKVDLFEYCLRMVIFTYLDVHFHLKKPPAVRYRAAAAVAKPLSVVLSVLAHAGQNRPEDIEGAFQAAAKHVSVQLSLAPRQECTLRAFDNTLARLAQTSPKVKRQIITAVTTCIATDGEVTIAESELLRAVAAALGCPMPPVVCTL